MILMFAKKQTSIVNQTLFCVAMHGFLVHLHSRLDTCYLQIERNSLNGNPQPCGSMNMVSVSIGGKDVVVPVTTIGGLATGAGVPTRKSFESGEPNTLLLTRLK